MSLNYSEVEEIALNEVPLHEATPQDETSADKQESLLLAIEEAAAMGHRSRPGQDNWHSTSKRKCR